MPVKVIVDVNDWMAVAQKKTAELLQMEATLNAVGRKASEQAEQIEKLEAELAEANQEEGEEDSPSRNGTGEDLDEKTTRPLRSGRRRKQPSEKG